jgi:hypothetical protein
MALRNAERSKKALRNAVRGWDGMCNAERSKKALRNAVRWDGMRNAEGVR